MVFDFLRDHQHLLSK